MTHRIRRAIAHDIPEIVAMLADDALGRARESPGHSAYAHAFAAIDADPNQFLAVMDLEMPGTSTRAIVGTLQLSFIPGLSHIGLWRGQIESVRIASSHRGQGYGRTLLTWAIALCHARGCRMIQLTSNASRHDAQRFYQQLGFEPSHVGYKLILRV